MSYPSPQEFEKLYGEFQWASTPPAVELWAKASQWARLDPRLAEILVGSIAKFWHELPAPVLNREIGRQPSPPAMGVLLEFAALLNKKKEPSSSGLFKKWSQTVMHGVSPSSHGQYFLGQRAFGGKLMREDAEYSLKPYLKWGYLGREVLLPKGQAGDSITLLPWPTRKGLLMSLLKARRRISVKDYLEYLDGKISRRQAELDLKRLPKVRKTGNTRNARYSY